MAAARRAQQYEKLFTGPNSTLRWLGLQHATNSHTHTLWLNKFPCEWCRPFRCSFSAFAQCITQFTCSMKWTASAATATALEASPVSFGRRTKHTHIPGCSLCNKTSYYFHRLFSFFSFRFVLVLLVVFLCFDLICMTRHDTKDARRFIVFTSLPMRHTSLLAVPSSRASRDRVHNSLSHLFEKVKLMTKNDNEIFSDNMAMATESRKDETPDDQTTKLVLHRYRNAHIYRPAAK